MHPPFWAPNPYFIHYTLWLSVLQDAPITGDSFIHALLSVSAVQRELSEILLHRLCDFVAEEEAPEGEASIPQLILGQFRW